MLTAILDPARGGPRQTVVVVAKSALRSRLGDGEPMESLRPPAHIKPQLSQPQSRRRRRPPWLPLLPASMNSALSMLAVLAWLVRLSSLLLASITAAARRAGIDVCFLALISAPSAEVERDELALMSPCREPTLAVPPWGK